MMRVALLALALLAAGVSSAQAEESGLRVLGSPKGCYVLGQVTHALRDKYLLDTCTGRVWQITILDDQTILKTVPFVSRSALEGSELWRSSPDTPPPPAK